MKNDGSFDAIVAKYFEGKGEKVGYDVTTTDVANTDDNFIVVTNCPFEPFEYLGTDGKIYGLDIEIAAAYAEAKDLDLVIKNINFDDIFTQVEAGYADIGMAGITASEDRKALYGFTQEYYEASQKLIVAAGNTDFDACKTVADVEAILASLQGKQVGFQIGTTGGMYVEGNEDCVCIRVPEAVTVLTTQNELISVNLQINREQNDFVVFYCAITTERR